MTGLNNWRVGLSWPEAAMKELSVPPDVEYLYEDDDGVTKSSFSKENALAAMLVAEAVFLNSHWWEDGWPEDAQKTTAICVNTNDVFAWGCADAEQITHDEIEEVYRYWAKDPSWGTAVWAIIRNKEMPQRPVAQKIREGGIWDLDALAKEHDLRPNHYDGIGRVIADRKRAAYKAWCEAEGKSPLPFDAGWWAGWREFETAHPGWNDDTWKAAEKAAIETWKAANGWTPKEPEQ